MNNVVIFNVQFHNIGQCRNNVVNVTICKKLKNKPGVGSKPLSFKYKFLIIEYPELKILTIFSNLFHFILLFKRNLLKNICRATNILKTPWKYCITRNIFKPLTFFRTGTTDWSFCVQLTNGWHCDNKDGSFDQHHLLSNAIDKKESETWKVQCESRQWKI